MMQLYAVTLLLALSRFSGAQLQCNVERPCPGVNVTFTCTIPSVGHQWKIPSLNIDRELLPSSLGRLITDQPRFQFTVTEVIPGVSITSTATVIATTDLNNTLVVCRDGVRMELEQRNTIKLSDPPSVPTLSCVDLSGDVSGTVNVTVSWTLSGGDNADLYLITTIAPQAPYGGLLNSATASIIQHDLTGFIPGYEYNITVRGVNCGSQKGSKSEPLTITFQVPADPRSCNISLSYNQLSKRLLLINSTWDTVPDPEDPCPGITGNITQYQIRFQNGSVVPMENVNITSCTAGRCSHTFVPPSNPPSSYDNVSVAAKNVVGVGAARACTTQTISTSNPLLTGEVVGVTSPTDARLNCRFVSWFVGTSRCTVQYGTDPTYMNLPYSAESTETGTAGDTVSVVLKERLNSSTVYYYTASAVSGDVTVTVQGNFATPKYTCNITKLWNQPAPGVTFLSDISSLDDAAEYSSCNDSSVGSVALVNTTLNTATVAYYSGITSGSMACFVCDDGYELNTTTTTERFCERSGLWSGNSIVCVCRLPPWTSPLIVLGALAMGATLVGVTVATIDGIIVCCINARKQNQRIRDCCSKLGKAIKDDWKNQCWLALLVIAGIFCVIGVALWITVGMMVSNPPNGNPCDPSWRSTRDGLIGSAFGASIYAYILAAAAVWVHVYYHKEYIQQHKHNRGIFFLLVIASILTFFGIGLWIASAVLVHIHCKNKCTTDGNKNDGCNNRRMAVRCSNVSH